MYYQSMQDSNNFLVDERFDDLYPTNNNQQDNLEYSLKKLCLDNQATPKNETSCKDLLSSDVFYFKEDIDDDYDSIQPVSAITANKMTNVYIPMISPIIEEGEAESEEDEESINESIVEKDEHDDFDETLSNHSTCSVYDYNSDLVQYYKGIILHTIDADTTTKDTLQSIDSTLPRTYKHYIQLIKNSNL